MSDPREDELLKKIREQKAQLKAQERELQVQAEELQRKRQRECHGLRLDWPK